ncbi:hypothetical protein P8452_75073 [Trifolium repens]|nr:hypothetical protein P8452_75073 [Trifolium repens]
MIKLAEKVSLENAEKSPSSVTAPSKQQNYRIALIFVSSGTTAINRSKNNRNQNGISRQSSWISIVLYKLINIHLLYFLGYHPALCRW